jgi:hypothetical protein
MAFQPGATAVTMSVSSAGQVIGIDNLIQCRVFNRGPDDCRIKYSSGGTSAQPWDMLMPAGLLEVHSKASTALYIAAVCESGKTSVLEICTGQGD